MHKILPAIFFSFLLLGTTPLFGMQQSQQNAEVWLKQGIQCFLNKEPNDALMW